MTEITDKTIIDYIKDTIKTLPNEIKDKVTNDYNDLKSKKDAAHDAKFIYGVEIYFFGVCLADAICELESIEQKTLEFYLRIFSAINKYLYKKQYESETKFLQYIPDSKQMINNSLGLIDKGGQLLNSESDNSKNKPLQPEYSVPQYTEFDNLYIPKLNKDVLTTPSLLKTTGLMNPEIAKMINDGKFTNITSFKLKPFSLQNQFVIRHRESKELELSKDIEKYKINKDSKAPQLNKYYLFSIIKNNNNTVDYILLLNAITHIEFQPGYLDNLKKMLDNDDRKERYIFTFGIFTGFKWDFEFIGQNHRCALIYDTSNKKIYYIDSLINSNNYLNTFNTPDKAYNSIVNALYYKLATIDNLKNYNLIVNKINLQMYDLKFKHYIRQSAYQRIRAGDKHFDWTYGYCGTYILLFLVIMILNPHQDIKTIMDFFIIISGSEHEIATNHEFLRLLVRSFALQIENYIYGKSKYIEFDNLDMNEYIKTNGNTVKIKNESSQYDLTPGAPDYYNSPMKNELLKAQMFHKNNVDTITAAFEDKNKTNVISEFEFILRRLFPIIGDMFRGINKLNTKMTAEQQKWQFENYGADDIIYFVKY